MFVPKPWKRQSNAAGPFDISLGREKKQYGKGHARMIGIRKKYIYSLLCILLAATLFWGLKWYLTGGSVSEKDEYEIDRSALENFRLFDNPALYTEYDQSEVVKVYVTVYEGIDEKTGQVYNFQELNRLDSEEDGDPALRASVMIGNPANGEYILGSDGGEINCTISMRGQSARKYNNKSYKIKLFDGAGSFRGQTVLNLNKNSSDYTRLKAKLSFDLISLFPDMVSLRNTLSIFISRTPETTTMLIPITACSHTWNSPTRFSRAHNLDPTDLIQAPGF
jgi:spore coat protein H